MIQLMRSKAATWVARVLAVFLIISFAVWGIEDMFRSPDASDVVAVVGPTEIGRQDFQRQFGRVMNTMRSRLGPEFDTQQAVQLGLHDQTLDQMINARLMTIEAESLGLDAGEELIRETIFKDERFRGIDERFDQNQFRIYLSREGMPEGAFVATLREQIVRNQVASAFGAATKAPKMLVDTLYRYQNEKRVADIVTIPLGKATAIPDPSETVLAEFHKNNPGLFTAPEYRKVVTIFLDPKEVAKGLSPSEDRIRQEFEHRKPALTVPERRSIEQALLQDEEKAKSLSQQLKQGRPFKEAVQEVTGKAPISLGLLAKSELPNKALTDAAFSLAKDTASEPIKTALGFHVLHVVTILPGKDPTLTEHRSEIRAGLANEMAVDDIIRMTEKLEDALGGGAPIEEAAAAIGVRALTIPAVDGNGLDTDGKPVKGLPGSPLFMERVFTTPTGETTNIEESRDGGFFTLRVDAVTKPALRPLDLARANVITEWKESRIQEAAREKAENLQKAAVTASSLASAAKEAGYNPVTSQPFTRFVQDSNATVSPELASTLFSAKPNEPIVSAVPSGYAVAVVTKVVPADPGKDKEATEGLKNQIEQALAGDAIGQFLDALRKRYSVEINRAAVESVAGISSGG